VAASRKASHGSPRAPRVEEVATTIQRVVAETTPSRGGVTLLYSGGLDSSLLAWLLRARLATRLLTVGVPGAPDLSAGSAGAQLIGLPWSSRELAPERVARSQPALVVDRRSPPSPLWSVQVALDLALDATEDATVMVGQGADELFWGYAHFRGLTPTEGRRRAQADLDRLLTVDWPATIGTAARHGRRLLAPYLDPRLVALAQSLDPEELSWTLESKPLLRAAAHRLGLPPPLAGRPKKAMQYGTGVDAILRRHTAPARRTVTAGPFAASRSIPPS
jgi:asparagine synthase (glutamine-hydrolysing)